VDRRVGSIGNQVFGGATARTLFGIAAFCTYGWGFPVVSGFVNHDRPPLSGC
jgi:hypothetical protein